MRKTVHDPAPSTRLIIDGPFITESSEGAGSPVLRVSGEVAYSTCRLLQDALVPHVAPGNRIVLDFSEVTLLDSSGIGVILRAQVALADMGGTLVVRNPTPATLQVLEVTGLQEMLVERPDGGTRTN
jgi:anti-anti-sigma factor